MALKRDDPYLTHNFLVRIDNTVLGGFSDCKGLSHDTDMIPYREGKDVNYNVRQLIGLRKYNAIQLMRGITTSRALWLWRLNIVNGVADRRNGSILLLNEVRKRVVEWHFEAGWISKYEGPTLNAKGNEVAIETIEIVHEGLRIVA